MTKGKSQENYTVFKSRVNSFNSSTPVERSTLENVIHFNSNDRTDEDIVYNSNIKTYLPIKTLINNSNDTRLARKNKKKGTNKIPRRQNDWIIYRRDKNKMPKFLGEKSYIVSREIAKMWNAEEKEVREFYAALSRLSIENHIRKYGSGYKYQPKQKKGKQQAKPTSSKSEQRTLTPPTSNDHSPATSPFKENITEFTVNTDLNSSYQLPPTPSTSNDSPVTSLSSEFEESLSDFPVNESLYEDDSEWITNFEMLSFPPLSDIIRNNHNITYDNHDTTYNNQDTTYDNCDIAYNNQDMTYDNCDIAYNNQDMTYDNCDMAYNNQESDGFLPNFLGYELSSNFVDQPLFSTTTPTMDTGDLSAFMTSNSDPPITSTSFGEPPQENIFYEDLLLLQFFNTQQYNGLLLHPNQTDDQMNLS